MKTDREKGEEILKKRRLAAKGLKERRDGKPIDPIEDADSLAIDKDADEPASPRKKQRDVADRGLAVGLGLRR